MPLCFDVKVAVFPNFVEYIGGFDNLCERIEKDAKWHAENPTNTDLFPIPIELPRNLQSLLEKHRILTTAATVAAKSKEPDDQLHPTIIDLGTVPGIDQ